MGVIGSRAIRLIRRVIRSRLGRDVDSSRSRLNVNWERFSAWRTRLVDCDDDRLFIPVSNTGGKKAAHQNQQQN